MNLMATDHCFWGETLVKLSEAIELGTLLERPGSSLSFKACAVGLGMAAVGVPPKERTARRARELWPWLSEVSHESIFGLRKVDYLTQISDWYFNVKLRRMTMATLLNRVRRIEPIEGAGAPETISVAGGNATKD